MVDVLFFLFITIFFIFKLKNNFGKVTEDDEKRKKSIEEFFKKKYSDTKTQTNNCDTIECKNVIDITDQIVEKNNNTIKLDIDISDTIRNNLQQINFNQDNFLKGVESAVEMINDAFSNKDLETLETILSKPIFLNFKKQIEELTTQNKILKSSLISILFNKINNIYMNGKNIYIDVLLNSEQINFIENDKKEIIQGSKKKIETIKEKWTFSRNLNSKNNFWIVENIINVE